MVTFRSEATGSGVIIVAHHLVIKRLFDRERSKRSMKIVLLGSASLSLQQGLSESLAGRYEIIFANHWSIEECREAFGWNFDRYIQFGGYPAAAELIKDISRWQNFIKNSIIEPVLGRDILGLTSIRKPALFRQTFELIMAYPAQEISLQKILGQLQEHGNVTTIKHYLNLFEGAYLIKVLQKYSGSAITKKGSSPKIVPLNSALVHAFQQPQPRNDNPEWYGRVFEAVVGAHLNQMDDHLYYWRKGNYEVDFILESTSRKKLYAIEVKSGRRKNTQGLSQFVKKYGKKAIPIIIDHSNIEEFLSNTDIETVLDRVT